MYIFVSYFKEAPHLEDYLYYKILKSIDHFINNYKRDDYFKEFFLKEKYVPLLFINGIGTGNILNLLKEYEINFKYLIIFESDISKLLGSFYYVDWEDLYQKYKVYLIIGNNEEKIEEGLNHIFSEIDPIYFSFVLFTNIYSNNAIHFKIHDIYKKVVHLLSKGWGFYDDEKIGLKNAFDNLKKGLPYLYKPSKPIENSYAFIIGSGPSLAKDIEYIKNNKDKAIIFSCGTSLHKLYKEGIVPDFHIELEREAIREKILLELPGDFLKKINLIAADVVPPSITNMFKNSFLFVRSNSTHQYLLNPSLVPPAITPTVVNSATSLAIILGFKNIYFFGTDMGYKDIRIKHVSGTIFDKEKYKYIEEKIDSYFKVEGNFTDNVYTDEILFWAKSSLEELISYFPDRTFVNFSDGALIKGTKKPDKYVEISNWIDKFKNKENIFSLFSSQYNSFMRPDLKDYYADLITLLEDVISVLDTKELNSRKDYFKKIDGVINILDKYKNEQAIYTLISGTIKSLISFLYKAILLIPEDKKLINVVDILQKGLNDIRKDTIKVKEYLDTSLLKEIFNI